MLNEDRIIKEFAFFIVLDRIEIIISFVDYVKVGFWDCIVYSVSNQLNNALAQ